MMPCAMLLLKELTSVIAENNWVFWEYGESSFMRLRLKCLNGSNKGVLKIINGSILGFFFVLTFLFALFPSKIRIARVIEIPASREKTMAVINDLGSWQKWNLFVNDSILT